MHRSWVLALVALALVGIFVFGFVAFRPGAPVGIRYYRVADENTIVIGVITGSGETRVTHVEETPETVTLTVEEFSWFWGASTQVGRQAELTVDLDAPLGGREVRDPTHVVRRED
jgi:hypothetical protein